jgi:methionyl-tRNA formyltransferase
VTEKTRLRVVFMGTPAVAVPVLSAILDAGHEVVGVYTQPDRPAGRERPLRPPEAKVFAVERGISVFQPASLRKDEKSRRALEALAPDVIVVAAYGLFLPADLLDLPNLGALNVHPSLLPRYRGPSPVASAILAGEADTGVTIIRLDEGMDSGPVVAQRETAIGADETAGDLTVRLFDMGAALLVENLPSWEAGDIQAIAQDHSQATVTARLARKDGEMEWRRPAVELSRQVRAYDLWPGTSTRWRGKLLKVLAASVSEHEVAARTSPGAVVALPDGRVGIGTGAGILEVARVQIEGRRAVTGREFVAGYRDFVGSVVGG